MVRSICPQSMLYFSDPVRNDSAVVRGFDEGPNIAVAVLLPAVSMGPKTCSHINDQQNETDLRDVSDDQTLFAHWEPWLQRVWRLLRSYGSRKSSRRAVRRISSSKPLFSLGIG